MMIVTVHHVDEKTGRVKELSRMLISNISGTFRLADYLVQVGAPSKLMSIPEGLMRLGRTERTGKVFRHSRLTEVHWELVFKALRSVGYGHQEEADEEAAQAEE